MKKELVKSNSQLEQPEEMHLVELNPNSIWMKINRFVLGRFAPDPDFMRNYCPYFWLTVCSCILLLPAVVVKLIWQIFVFFGFLFEHAVLLPAERAFFKAFQIDEDVRLDVLSSNDFEGYGRWHKDLPWYVNKDHYSDMFDAWIEQEMKSKKTSREDLLRKLGEIFAERRELEKQKKAAQQMSWKMPKVTFIDRWGDSLEESYDNFIEKTRDIVQAQKMLIKATQRFLGFVVSIAIAVAIYFALSLISRLIIWLSNIWSWEVILTGLKFIGFFVGVVIILIIAAISLKALFEWLIKIVPANNFFFKGVKIFIVTPLYFIFAIFLWKIVCVKFFWQILIKFLILGFVLFIVRGIIGVGPLFKSYFGQEYSSLCPGIKWVEK